MLPTGTGNVTIRVFSVTNHQMMRVLNAIWSDDVIKSRKCICLLKILRCYNDQHVVYLSVLLLLSILTVQGSGCDEFMKTTVRNLQRTVDGEKTKGFPEVFPKNYLVSHYFNDSAVCNEPCCVFSGAVFLSNSWSKLLQHLNRVHLKYHLISELIYTLDILTKEKFQETPDIANFPSIQSTPEDLLSFTSLLFSKWLSLDCAFGEHRCIFPIPSEEDEEDLESKEEENREISEQVDEQKPVIEGQKSKRQLDLDPTSGYTELCFPGFFQWTLYFLWIATHAFLIS